MVVKNHIFFFIKLLKLLKSTFFWCYWRLKWLWNGPIGLSYSCYSITILSFGTTPTKAILYLPILTLIYVVNKVLNRNEGRLVRFDRHNITLKCKFTIIYNYKLIKLFVNVFKGVWFDTIFVGTKTSLPTQLCH